MRERGNGKNTKKIMTSLIEAVVQSAIQMGSAPAIATFVSVCVFVCGAH